MADAKQDQKVDNSDTKTNTNNNMKSYSLLQRFKVESKSFDVNDEKSGNTKMFRLRFTDKTSENKHQIYEKIFTLQDCNNIITESKCSAIPVSNFVRCVLYCVSETNSKHNITYSVKEHCLSITITYKTELLSLLFVLNIPKKKMNEIEILKLRVQECEQTIADLRQQLCDISCIYEPIILSEVVTDSKRRNQGWNNIPLNHSSHQHDEFVQLNVENGTFSVEKGVYFIEAHAESWNVQGIIIQLRSDDEQIIINGIPSYSTTIGASRLMRQVMHVQHKCNIIFRHYCKVASDHGCHYNCHWPKQELDNIYVACVSIQKIK